MNSKITIRISEDLRDQLDARAKLEGISTSELARTILEESNSVSSSEENSNFVNYNKVVDEYPKDKADYKEGYDQLCLKLEVIKTMHEEECIKLLEDKKSLERQIGSHLQEKEDVVYSLDFLKLVSWIYYQRSGFGYIANKEDYEKFKNILIKIQLSDKFSKKLKDNFNLVFANIIKVEDNILANHTNLEFAQGHFPKFNYTLLNNFIFKENCGVNLKTKNISL